MKKILLFFVFTTVLHGQTTAPLKITTVGCLDATAGRFYSCQLTATGGTPPYHWSVSSGTLPPGLTLSDSGLISGTIPKTSQPSNLKIMIAGNQIKIKVRKHAPKNHARNASRIWYPGYTNQSCADTTSNNPPGYIDVDATGPSNWLYVQYLSSYWQLPNGRNNRNTVMEVSQHSSNHSDIVYRHTARSWRILLVCNSCTFRRGIRTV